ncbi:MAG: thioredoxin [Verrucomicrobiaceae bacterium]|nr:thioredoxin [Verrucomicrobiaceae bacterium]
MKTPELTSATFDSTLGSTTQPVLVDFYTEGCGPCLMTAPIIDLIASEQSGSAVVAKIDAGIHADIAARYGITAVPTLIVFKNGQPIASTRGAQSKAAIEALLAQAA